MSRSAYSTKASVQTFPSFIICKASCFSDARSSKRIHGTDTDDNRINSANFIDFLPVTVTNTVSLVIIIIPTVTERSINSAHSDTYISAGHCEAQELII